LKLSFDPSKPDERERAASVVKDMFARGYAILVEVGKGDDGEPMYSRAKAFDAKRCEYIIVGVPEESTAAAVVDQPIGAPAPKRRGRPPGRRVAAETTRTVAVARSAGG
jgi:hypothetical protein